MIRSFITFGNIRSLVVVRDGLINSCVKCSMLGGIVSVRNVRTRRRQFLPKFTEQLEKPRGRQEIDLLDETDIVDELDDEMGIANFDHRDLQQHKRQTVAEKMFIKRKIVEKKYFKQPREPNILSWNTKEYMRLLHRRDPDEWTVEKLSNSFPVSRDSVDRILKSTYRPKTEDEIVKHDKRALKNFLAVKATLGAKQIAAYDHVLKKMQTDAHLLLADSTGSLDHSLEKVDRVGVFEAIVQDIPIKCGSSVQGLEHSGQQQLEKKKVR